ncbi:MAG: NAD(P)H-hydrate dehydratase [Rhodobacteraceae bacterium]|nr:MAG: NAD(P)H-hydrate dehydratase [Paracoccaceae bacterium]
MTELLTAAQMRAIEQAAIDSGEVTGLELMERAGRGVVEAVFEEWPELAKSAHRAVVLCGPGNNGGDGFVVARLLKEWGWDVDVFLYGNPDKLPPDAKANYERWRALGEVDAIDNLSIPVGPSGASVVFDALFGTGLARPLENLESVCFDLADFVDLTRDGTEPTGSTFRTPLPKVVSIDIPSGFCADSGRFLGHKSGAASLNEAHLTVVFHQRKVGNMLDLCSQCCGKIAVASIGLEGSPQPSGRGEAPSSRIDCAPSARRGGRGLPSVPPGETVKLIDAPNISVLKHDGHKYAHGHALILSGGPGKTGAARLAARGALRIGAGLVTIGSPLSALSEVAAQVTAIMCRPLDGAPGLAEMLEDDRLNALCLGPGMGLGADTQHLVLAALAAKRGTVLDADALTRFERNSDVLFDALHENVVLTPHAGEFERLFPDIAEKLDAPATAGPAYSKVDATREAAARAGCTILFKGPDTVIADPSGRCAINSSAYDRAAPWLATAGSGDVLAGFITGLLARGFAPMQAAETAAWLHTECALAFGPGLIAEDLPEQLPIVFEALLT